MKNMSNIADSGAGCSYGCKINDISYTCELNTDASDNVLNTSAAKKWSLEIGLRTEPATLGDGTTVSTAGMKTASTRAIGICSEEEVHSIPSKEVPEVLALGQSWKNSTHHN